MTTKINVPKLKNSNVFSQLNHLDFFMFEDHDDVYMRVTQIDSTSLFNCVLMTGTKKGRLFSASENDYVRPLTANIELEFK